MGATLPKIKSPLRCILENWDQFDTQSLKKKRLVFLCGTVWPKYPLLSGKTWPPKGSIDYDTILQLDLFCKSECKWFELPYVQLFFSLKKKPQLCQACSPYPTQPSSVLSPHLGLPVASTSTNVYQGSSASIPQQEPGRAEMAKASQVTRMPSFCPLQAVGGEFVPTTVRTRFSLSDLKKIKVNLGKFSDDPDKYIDVLQGLGQSFELNWKDIMLLLNQTLTSNEREAALAAAQEFGDTWYLSQIHDLMTPEEKDRFPTGRQAVPGTDPHWDPDSEQGDWSRRHFLTCILEGLKRTKKKPMNYAMLSTITQGREENPTAFLERLREALRKYTPLSPDSIEGQLILKDKFIMQSAADIRRKLQKLALGPVQSVESLLNLATSVFNNRDQEEQAERNRRDQRKPAALVMAFRQADPRGSNEGKPWISHQASRACYQCGQRGHFIRNCPQRNGPPPSPCPLCQGDHWKAHCPRGRRFPGPEMSKR
uniref:CCHC-type domain-containing protein n=1 Tax=Callithrix jacchus TaxID=9483 RepID=A0A8I3W1Z0_CALJA